MLTIFKNRIKILRKFGDLQTITTKKIKKRNKTPGEHGILKNQKSNDLLISDDYLNRLIEKQKLRFFYGLSEKQLFLYYKKAKKEKGLIIDNLLKILVSRLDYIIFKNQITSTIFLAKQIINHNHILINNKKVNISSYLCSKKDTISFSNNLKTKNLIFNISKNKENINFINLENYFNNINYNEILSKINLIKIIEFYSK
jgi:small subunit ribosomal protein S4